MRVQLLLAVFLPAAFAFTLFHNPVELIAALTALAVVVVIVGTPTAPRVVPVRSLSMRERSQRAAFMRLRDPDAAGRPRPRAPGCQG